MIRINLLKIGSVTAALIMAAFLFGAQVEWPGKLNASEYWIEGPKQTQSTPAPQIDVNALNSVFSSIAERLSPSVVNIFAKTKFKYQLRGNPGVPDEFFKFFFGNPLDEQVFAPPLAQEAQTLGSGFIINKDG